MSKLSCCYFKKKDATYERNHGFEIGNNSIFIESKKRLIEIQTLTKLSAQKIHRNMKQ